MQLVFVQEGIEVQIQARIAGMAGESSMLGFLYDPFNGSLPIARQMSLILGPYTSRYLLIFKVVID